LTHPFTLWLDFRYSATYTGAPVPHQMNTLLSQEVCCSDSQWWHEYDCHQSYTPATEDPLQGVGIQITVHLKIIFIHSKDQCSKSMAISHP